MPTATGRTASDGRREELERLVRALEANRMNAAVTRSLKSVLAAKDYNDPTLLLSSLNDTLLGLAEAVNEELVSQHELVDFAKEVCREELEQLTGKPAENYDDTGRQLEDFLSGLLTVFERGRELVQSLVSRGYEVQNADLVDRDIEELRALKKQTLGDWPWSDQDVPPALSGEVAEKSRRAISEGGGERIEDLINRLGGGRPKD